jgi:hypothetical protein
LQRQRDRRVASARKERLRLRRQLVRQRAFQAMRHALWAGMLVVSAWYVFALTALRAGIFSVGRLITRGARVAGRRIQAGASWMVAKLGVLAHRLGALVVAGSLFAASKSGTAARTSRATRPRAGWRLPAKRPQRSKPPARKVSPTASSGQWPRRRR